MIPKKTIEDLISKHLLLEKELSSGEVDKKLFAEKSKEYSDLNEIVEDAKKYFSYENEKQDLEKILEDSSSDDDFKSQVEEFSTTLRRLDKPSNAQVMQLFLHPQSARTRLDMHQVIHPFVLA